MRFSSAAAIVLGLAPFALASPTPAEPARARDGPSNDCKLGGAGGIQSPAFNEEVAPSDQGFKMVFCSGEYFKTSTQSIDVIMLNNASEGGSGFTIAKDLKPTTASGYDATLYFSPDAYSGPESKDWTLLVYERHTSYGSSNDTFTAYSQHVTVG
ncbi:hypothetical protein IE81DRAFT_350039 [Ceraceosorus guamensis]|uniref:Uncharacterized protein n=1 Tax=Ceraceosorus guamensis TaxID=1522189 RepID=A0A316VQT7_9BASI|nr:hypothetical protein IE81DRAFT_350039 [Ceraceosorus guamensis]PWN39574.1 hypothetical protein IE81DRAFT_350039 [Ceraceosorus guamensis]